MLTYHRITTLDDPLLVPLMELYRSAFPPEERVDDERFSSRAESPHHSLVAVLESGSFVGFYDLGLAEAFSGEWLGLAFYFAVLPNLRGQGVGSEVFGHICSSIDAIESCIGLIFEVERPDLALDASDRLLRQRRIAFYERFGARVLPGINYVQPALGDGKKPVPLHLMFRPHGEVRHSPEELQQAFMRCAWGCWS